jgi:hypothetical protein
MIGRFARIAPMIGRGPRSSPRLGWARTIGRRFRVVRPRLGAALAVLRRVSPRRLLRLRLAWSTSPSTTIAVVPVLRTATRRLSHSALVVRSSLSTILRTRAGGAAGSPAASVQVLSPPSRGRSPWASPAAPDAARHDVRRPRPQKAWHERAPLLMGRTVTRLPPRPLPERIPTTHDNARHAAARPAAVHRRVRVEEDTLRRVAVQHRVERHIQRREAVASQRAAQAVRDSLAAPAPPAAPPALDLDRLTEAVVRQIDQRLIAHRERMGRGAF